jgi:hypothetical protein
MVGEMKFDEKVRGIGLAILQQLSDGFLVFKSQGLKLDRQLNYLDGPQNTVTNYA